MRGPQSMKARSFGSEEGSKKAQGFVECVILEKTCCLESAQYQTYSINEVLLSQIRSLLKT